MKLKIVLNILLLIKIINSQVIACNTVCKVATVGLDEGLTPEEIEEKVANEGCSVLPDTPQGNPPLGSTLIFAWKSCRDTKVPKIPFSLPGAFCMYAYAYVYPLENGLPEYLSMVEGNLYIHLSIAYNANEKSTEGVGTYTADLCTSGDQQLTSFGTLDAKRKTPHFRCKEFKKPQECNGDPGKEWGCFWSNTDGCEFNDPSDPNFKTNQMSDEDKLAAMGGGGIDPPRQTKTEFRLEIDTSMLPAITLWTGRIPTVDQVKSGYHKDFKVPGVECGIQTHVPTSKKQNNIVDITKYNKPDLFGEEVTSDIDKYKFPQTHWAPTINLEPGKKCLPKNGPAVNNPSFAEQMKAKMKGTAQNVARAFQTPVKLLRANYQREQWIMNLYNNYKYGYNTELNSDLVDIGETCKVEFFGETSQVPSLDKMNSKKQLIFSPSQGNLGEICLNLTNSVPAVTKYRITKIPGWDCLLSFNGINGPVDEPIDGSTAGVITNLPKKILEHKNEIISVDINSRASGAACSDIPYDAKYIFKVSHLFNTPVLDGKFDYHICALDCSGFLYFLDNVLTRECYCTDMILNLKASNLCSFKNDNWRVYNNPRYLGVGGCYKINNPETDVRILAKYSLTEDFKRLKMQHDLVSVEGVKTNFEKSLQQTIGTTLSQICSKKCIQYDYFMVGYTSANQDILCGCLNDFEIIKPSLTQYPEASCRAHCNDMVKFCGGPNDLFFVFKSPFKKRIPTKPKDVGFVLRHTHIPLYGGNTHVWLKIPETEGKYFKFGKSFKMWFFTGEERPHYNQFGSENYTGHDYEKQYIKLRNKLDEMGRWIEFDKRPYFISSLYEIEWTFDKATDKNKWVCITCSEEESLENTIKLRMSSKVYYVIPEEINNIYFSQASDDVGLNNLFPNKDNTEKMSQKLEEDFLYMSQNMKVTNRAAGFEIDGAKELGLRYSKMGGVGVDDFKVEAISLQKCFLFAKRPMSIRKIKWKIDGIPPFGTDEETGESAKELQEKSKEDDSLKWHVNLVLEHIWIIPSFPDDKSTSVPGDATEFKDFLIVQYTPGVELCVVPFQIAGNDIPVCLSLTFPSIRHHLLNNPCNSVFTKPPKAGANRDTCCGEGGPEFCICKQLQCMQNCYAFGGIRVFDCDQMNQWTTLPICQCWLSKTLRNILAIIIIVIVILVVGSICACGIKYYKNIGKNNGGGNQQVGMQPLGQQGMMMQQQMMQNQMMQQQMIQPQMMQPQGQQGAQPQMW